MRILIVAEFDPAGVMLGHRDVLRAQGWDCRVALATAFTARQDEAEWVDKRHHGYDPRDARAILSTGHGDIDELRAFADVADVIQMCPAIGQPWSGSVELCLARDVPHARYFGIDWSAPTKAARVILWHGSPNLWANAAEYRRAFTGWHHAATTLDYAEIMHAAYLPPVAPVVKPAELRADGEPLIVSHAPTDLANCHTEALRQAASRRGVMVRLSYCRTHDEVMKTKQTCNAGFDHMRGSFSVNSIENCALGLANIVGLRYADRLAVEGIARMPGPHPNNEAELDRALIELRDSPARTRELQVECEGWSKRWFNSQAIAERLTMFYGKAVR